MVLNPFQPQYHTAENFREQLAVLYFAGISNERINLLRSYVRVGLPGMTSFDKERPGADSLQSWQIIDEMIEKEGVCGVFHTHPPNVDDFSAQDWESMRAFALANGKKYLFYGVQAAEKYNRLMTHFVCLNAVNGSVFVYDCGCFSMNPSEVLISLPLPPKVESDNNMFVINL